ncbi:DUF3243 domain-containing protein [Cohnella sp. JJ-181]|uniref:DUF3243 domain-containing protein n=1 Tax=Cohnella rhizoplanae TaxID=2974897 RepID=UPI0022FF82FE|nr:DUF3243 domain-containing protein [Cohnella sp. JJ-181]CAI6086013.1 hypothetical protein COHCIP112018_04875 [Cohnella sp. JJ-181]
MSETPHIIDKAENIDASKVGDTISRIDAPKKDEILSNFQSFKSYLNRRIALGESLGLSEEQLAQVAEKVADYLAEHEDPRNAEENLLKELWKVGEQDERHKLAHMLVRLAQQS